MIRFLFRRLLLLVPLLFLISVTSFMIIQLPPGDFASTYFANMSSGGEGVSQEELEQIRDIYGLNQSIPIQYFKWIIRFAQGDFGRSMEWKKPVASLIWERLGYSMILTLFSFCLIWVISIPIGVYSATHQYSMGDYIASTLGFLGLSIPNFLLALIILFLVFHFSGAAAVGLFSDKYQLAPWSPAKVWDLAQHLVVPALIVGASGLASTIKLIRSNLLDELQKPYVLVARSKGLKERSVLYRYPFRIAINPAISTVGWLLPSLVSGEVMVSLVLGLPTIAPLLLKALQSQDMYLASGILLILSVLTVVGTLVSDILLAIVDPRIRQDF